MNVIAINNTHFSGLNYSKVNKSDMRYVRDELPELKKLGEKYDIRLESKTLEIGLKDYYDTIKITVAKLKDNLHSFQRGFSKKRSNYFFMEKAPYPEADGETIVSLTKQSISYL